MKTKNTSFSLLAVAGVMLIACNKDAKTSTLHIRMTDAPTALEEVNIDLKQINVKMAGDSTKWLSMDTKSGIYNLLNLQNGIDTLVAQDELPAGTVQEIRFVLGNVNTVKNNGQTYPLTVPSGAESGLKIKVDKQLNASLDSLLIDFDAALSVKQESDGYKLRPVLRVKQN